MMKLCARLVRGDLALARYFPVPTRSLPAQTSCPRLAHSSYIARTQLKTEDNAEPEKVISVKVPDSPLILSVIDNLEVYNFTKDEIVQLFEKQPRLVNSSVNSWSELVQFFYGLSFEKSEVLRILEEWPEILRFNKTTLQKNFQAWSDIGLGENLLFLLLTTHPMFLMVDDRKVTKCVKKYQAFFESKKRAGKLLLLAPNVLEDSWKSVLDKINYLDDLCTDKSDIVSSGVLRHSLFHIKARHEFLIRAGLYKLPTKDFNKRLSKNHTLESIVNTTDNEFVSKIARLSMFEYEVFLDFFQQEVEEESDSEDEYDSDDESTYRNTYFKKGLKK